MSVPFTLTILQYVLANCKHMKPKKTHKQKVMAESREKDLHCLGLQMDGKQGQGTLWRQRSLILRPCSGYAQIAHGPSGSHNPEAFHSHGQCAQWEEFGWQGTDTPSWLNFLLHMAVGIKGRGTVIIGLPFLTILSYKLSNRSEKLWPIIMIMHDTFQIE